VHTDRITSWFTGRMYLQQHEKINIERQNTRLTCVTRKFVPVERRTVWFRTFPKFNGKADEKVARRLLDVITVVKMRFARTRRIFKNSALRSFSLAQYIPSEFEPILIKITTTIVQYVDLVFVLLAVSLVHCHSLLAKSSRHRDGCHSARSHPVFIKHPSRPSVSSGTVRGWIRTERDSN